MYRALLQQIVARRTAETKFVKVKAHSNILLNEEKTSSRRPRDEDETKSRDSETRLNLLVGNERRQNSDV